MYLSGKEYPGSNAVARCVPLMLQEMSIIKMSNLTVLHNVQSGADSLIICGTSPDLVFFLWFA